MLISGQWEVVDDADWFRLNLAGDTTYRFAMLGAESTIGGLRVESDVDDDGFGPGTGFRSETSSFDFASSTRQTVFTPFQGGTYYAQLDRGTSDSGSYRVWVDTVQDDFADHTGTSGRIEPGNTIAGRFETRDDADWIRTDLQADTTYRVSVSVPEAQRPQLRVDSPNDGNGLTQQDRRFEGDFSSDNGAAVFTPFSDSRYYIKLDSTFAGTGEYSVSVESISDDYPDHAGTSGAIAPGGTVEGVFEAAGDADWFRAELQGGTTYRIAADADFAIAAASAEDGDGLFQTEQRFEQRADGGVTFTPQQGGTYYVQADSEFGTASGGYSIDLTAVADDYADTVDTTGAVAPGGTANGRFENRGDQDWFRTDLSGGTTYQVTISAGTQAPSVVARSVADSDGLLADDRQPGQPAAETGRREDGFAVAGDSAASAVFTPRTDSTWYVEANDASGVGGRGGYSVSVNAVTDDFADTTATTGSVAVGGSTSGRIEVSGDSDWFALDLAADETYRVSVAEPDTAFSSLQVSVLSDGDGDGLAEGERDIRNERASSGAADGGQQAVFTPLDGGRYYVRVEGAFTEPTDYTVSVDTVTDDFADTTATDGVASGAGGTGADLQLLNLTVAQQVAAVYLGYFGRAPEPGGLDFWVGEYRGKIAEGKGPSSALTGIAESFRRQTETLDSFPFLDPDRAGDAGEAQIRGFVESVFQNLFDRQPSTAGQDFWTGEIQDRLDAGVALGDLIIDIISGAQDGIALDYDGDGTDETTQDASIIRNKIEVATAYGQTVDPSVFDNDRSTAVSTVDDIGGALADLQSGLDNVETLGSTDTGGFDAFQA